jgi:hypothetical protein
MVQPIVVTARKIKEDWLKIRQNVTGCLLMQ